MVIAPKSISTRQMQGTRTYNYSVEEECQDPKVIETQGNKAPGKV